MKRFSKKLSVVVVLSLLSLVLLISCGGGDGDSPTSSSSPSLEGISATLTDNDNFAALAVHQNGEKLITMTQPDASGNTITVTGAVWTSSNNESIVVFLGDDGLPERAVFGDIVVLYSNYTNNTVDVAVVAPDGAFEITRNAPIDANAISELRSSNAIRSKPQSNLSDLADMLRYTSVIVNTAVCVKSIIFAPGTLGLSLLFSGSCGSALVTSMQLVSPEDNAALAATGAYLSTYGCITDITKLSCAALLLDYADALIQEANTTSTPTDDALTALTTPTTTEPSPTTEPIPTPTPLVRSCDLQGTWEGYWINAKTGINYVLTIASQDGSNFQGNAYLTSDDPQYYARYSLRGTVNENCSHVSFVEYEITEQNSPPSFTWCVPCNYEMELNDTLTVIEGNYICPDCGESGIITGQARFER